MISKRFKKLPTKTALLPATEIKKLLPEVKKNCTTKFDESIDLNLQINNKQKKGEINLRTVVNMPAGTGKKIKNGDLNFEKLICTTNMMIKLAKLGKILGPKGLMPNPKLGSVTNDLNKAVKDAKSGQVEIKNDKDGNIGVSIGKKSFTDENLIKNFNAVFETLEKEKGNNTIKGDLVKNSYLTSTMGVSYKLKLPKNI